MKVGVYDLDGNKVKEIELPEVFLSPVRPDLIWRAVLAIRSKRFQPKGRSPTSGKKYVVVNLGKGYDRARIARIFGGTGPAKFVAQAVGGLRVRAPKSNKVIVEKINKKEKLRALESALAATIDPILVQMRGHLLGDVKELPIVLVDDFENLKKTAEVRETIFKLGLKEEFERVKEGRRQRAGKGKRRGRRLKRRKGPLIVVSNKEASVILAARNLEGVDVVPVEKLSVEHLAPGGHPGRLVIWTESSIKKLAEIIQMRWEKLRSKKVDLAKVAV
mgnify:CR=1 FL=1